MLTPAELNTSINIKNSFNCCTKKRDESDPSLSKSKDERENVTVTAKKTTTVWKCACFGSKE